MAKYEMQVNRSGAMEQKAMLTLRDIYLAPYMQLATALIGKQRRAGGNMFRHQLDTMTILIDYGYIDSVLLKASCIHDVVEDIPGFDTNSIINVDEEDEDKPAFLRRIINEGSQKAKILKTADRISNMISLGYVTDPKFIERYCDETEFFIFPIALEIDYNMYQELISLVMTRRKYLEDSGYIK